MFSTLESNWDNSARRGRATLASFAVQAFGLSLLIAISLLWVERPPQVHWLQISAPATFTQVATDPAPGHRPATTPSNPAQKPIIAPPSIPLHAAPNDADSAPSAPDLPNIGYGRDHGPSDVIPGAIGNAIPIVIPARPAALKPLRVSDVGEGSLLHRVQPTYPALAREVRVQGAVELRAIISKTGTIENLVIVRGHPMLSAAAIEAVRQWRYRPYLLNGEPIEVETEITVNFTLSGG
jgi:protein TonB